MKLNSGNTVSVNRRMLVVLAAVFSLILSACFLQVRAYAEEGGADGMTITVTGEVSGADQQVQDMIGQGQIDIRAGQTEDGGVLNVDVWVGDYDLLSLRASVDAENLNIQIPQADDTVYTIRGEKVMEWMEQLNGMMSQDGGNPFAALQPPAITPEEYQEIFAPYLQLVAENIQQSLSMAQGETAELKMLGETVENCTLYTYQPSAESMQTFLNGLADTMETDAGLENVVTQWADFLENAGGLLNVTAAGNSVDMAEVAGQIKERYAQLPAMIRENADTIAQTLAAVNFRILVYVDENSTPVMIEMLGENEDQTMRIAFEGQIADDDIRYYIGAEVPGTSVYTTGHTTESNGVVEGEHMSVSDGETLSEVTYSFDLNSLSVIGIPYGEFNVNASGAGSIGFSMFEAENGGDTLELSFNGEEVTGETASSATVWVNFVASVDQLLQPEGPTVDISDYTMDDYMNLVGEIASKIMGSLSGEDAA